MGYGIKLKTQSSKRLAYSVERVAYRKTLSAKRYPLNAKIWILSLSFTFYALSFTFSVFGQDVRQPNVAGQFYPSDAPELSATIDKFFTQASPQTSDDGEPFVIIVPHAGYGFSGQTAAYAYKLIKDRPYKTVVIVGPAHYYAFSSASVYTQGFFRTPLGNVEVDSEFARQMVGNDKDILFEPAAFEKEHSVEVQIPFLQKTLKDFKIVPVVIGDCTYSTCQKLAHVLKEAIGARQDVLIVISSDMYHGFDYDEARLIDNATLGVLQKIDAENLYYGLREGKFQLCGGFGAVTALILAADCGYNKLTVLNHTDSAQATGKMIKGIWTVGYGSSVIYGKSKLPAAGAAKNQETALRGAEKGEKAMLDTQQRKKLLNIARNAIETYLKTGVKPEIKEEDPLLLSKMGAFVTLHSGGELRGCIGNLIGKQPLVLTVRDMAVESAVGDPRFSALELSELKNVEIEISALSPMERVNSADDIELGRHGVMVKHGFRSGVFLPQVATETGWSKEEFLGQLCYQKAGLPYDAWKDKNTELYVFTAEVFSEGNTK